MNAVEDRAVEDRESEFASDLADLRQVPLAEVHAQGDDAISGALRRALSEQSAHAVPVAAFNSSI
jgi:FXSXX-COOH protein